MTTVRVIFEKVLQDSQELGSTDEHMVSRVFFKLQVEGKEYGGFYCNLKQMVGAQYESTSPIEVSRPAGAHYRGPFNYGAFREQVEQYYRDAFGAHGMAIRVGPGASNIRMFNNTVVRAKTIEFEASEPDATW